MPTTGNLFPTVGENNAGIGVTAWTNPGNVASDNAADATCNAPASSQYLVVRGFNFGLPSTAEIVGITVRVEASEHSTGTEILNARLQDSGGTLVGTGKTATISGTAKVVYTYGGAADVWGATLTPAIVNDANFGVRLWFTTSHDIRIDYVTIAVQYNEPTLIDGQIGISVANGLAAAVTLSALLTASVGSSTASGATASVTGGDSSSGRITWAAVYPTARIAANIGTSIASGPQAVVSGQDFINATVGAGTASGLQASITGTVVTGSITWSAVYPTAKIDGTTGSATAAGALASLSGDTTLACAIGSATASGQQAAISAQAVTGRISWSAVYATDVVPGSVGAAAAAGSVFSLGDGVTIQCQAAPASAFGLAFTLTSFDQQIAGAWSPSILQRFWMLSGALDVLINGTVGAASSTGLPADVTGPQVLPMQLGSATASGQPANVVGSQMVAASVGAATASAPAATIIETVIIACATGAASAQGLVADATGPQSINAAIGSATASGAQALVGAGLAIAAQIGSATASGLQATVDQNIGAFVGGALASGRTATIAETINTVIRAATAGMLRGIVRDAFTQLTPSEVMMVRMENNRIVVPMDDNRVRLTRSNT